MAQQECDLQTLLRKLNEIDTRTKDTEKALKLLGQYLLSGQGNAPKGGLQNVDDRNIVPRLELPVEKLLRETGNLSSITKRLAEIEQSLRKVSGQRTVEDLKAGGGDIRQSADNSREAKVIAGRTEKTVQSLVVIIAKLESDIKVIRQKVNDTQFVVNADSRVLKEVRVLTNNTWAGILNLSPLIRETRKLANDSFSAILTLSPIIRETRKLSNDIWAGILSLSPVIRKTEKNVNDMFFLLKTMAASLLAIGKNANDAVAGIQSVSRKLDDFRRDTTLQFLAASALAYALRPQQGPDVSGLIRSMWDNLLLVIRGEASRVQGNMQASLASSTTQVINRVAYTETWLTNILRQDKSDILSSIFSNTAGIPAAVARITALQAEGINAHTTRGLLALLDQIIEEIRKEKGDKKVLAYLEANHSLSGFGSFCEVKTDGTITYTPQQLSAEAILRQYGARLFVQQPVDPGTPNGAKYPLGVVACTSPDELAKNLMAISFYRHGLHQLPAQVPESIQFVPTQQNPTSPLVSIDSMVEYSTWQFRQLDGTLGFFPLEIKNKQKDGTVKTVKIDNVAEGMAELFGLSILNDSDMDTLLEIAIRDTGETIQSKGMLSLIVDYLKAQSDFMGYKSSPATKKMPVLFSPAGKSMKDFLKDGEVEIQTHELKDAPTNDMISKLNLLIMGVSKLAGTLLKRYPDGDKVNLDGFELRKDLNAKDVDFEKFLVWLRTEYAVEPALGGDAKLSKVDVTNKTAQLTQPPVVVP